MNYLIFSLMLLTVIISNAYKILVIMPIYSTSHWLFMKSIITAILDRGHDVSCITSYEWKGPKPKNYTEILIDVIDAEKTLPQEKIYRADGESLMKRLIYMPMIGKATTEHSLNSSNVQKFLHQNDSRFDLVINEEFHFESFLMFGFMFKAPLITISPYGYSDFFDRDHGLFTPWSHVPHVSSTFTDNMTIFERLENAVISLIDWMIRRYIHLPSQNHIAQKYFGHLLELPSIEDLVRNVSVILINTHRSVVPPRPAMPSIVYIGGAHIKEPKSLQTDIQTFLDGAQNGAIYFSFGTFIQSDKMPAQKMKMFLSVFKQLKQRVLWKYDNDPIPNLPSNVMVRKWVPQNDILAHPKVVLFISHGGMFGHLESLYRGVPLLIIPFFGDQFRNAKRAQQNGYAKHLTFNELNENLLISAIQDMTTNETYSQKATIFKDNVVHPMDNAIWWIEHVAKFGGGKYLKSHAVNMTWFSYLLLDVIAVILLGGLSTSFVLYVVIKKCCRKTAIRTPAKQKQKRKIK